MHPLARGKDHGEGQSSHKENIVYQLMNAGGGGGWGVFLGWKGCVCATLKCANQSNM